MANPILPLLILAGGALGLVQYDKAQKAKKAEAAKPKPLPPVTPGTCVDDATCAATLAAFLPLALHTDPEALEAARQLAGKMGQNDLANYIGRLLVSLQTGQPVTPATRAGEPPEEIPIPPPPPPSTYLGAPVSGGSWVRYGAWKSPDGVAWTFDGWGVPIYILPGEQITPSQVDQIAGSYAATPPPFVYQQAWIYPIDSNGAGGPIGAWYHSEQDDLINYAITDKPVSTWVYPLPGQPWNLGSLPNGQTRLFPAPVQEELHRMTDQEGRHFVWIVQNSRSIATIKSAAGVFLLVGYQAASGFLVQLAQEIGQQGKGWEWDSDVPESAAEMQAYLEQKFGVTP